MDVLKLGLPKPNTTPGAGIKKPLSPPTQAPLNNVQLDAQGNTQYVNKGGQDLNQILYLKKLYEGAGDNAGQKSYASNAAGASYANLDPNLANQVKGMDAQHLNDYINGLGGSQGVAGGSGNTSNDYIQQMRDLAAKNLEAKAYDSRNQTDAINLQNAQGLQELMANRGLGASGENITATLNQNAQRSNSLNSINNQLTENLNNLDIDANNQRLNQANMDRDYGLDYANVYGFGPDSNGLGSPAGNSGGNQGFLAGSTPQRLQTLAARNADRGYDLDVARMSGNLPGGGKTLDAIRQLADLTGYYNNNPTFDREQFNRGNMVDDRNYNRGVLESDRGYNRGVLESDRGYNRGVLESDRSYGLASNKAANSSSGSDSKPANLNTIIDNVNSLYTAYDKSSGQRSITNPDKLRNYILVQNLPDDQTDQLLAYYGLLDGQSGTSNSSGSSNGGGPVSGLVEMR